MSSRNRIVRVLLILYAVGSAAIIVVLLLDLPGAGDLAGTTSGKILAAALFALAFAAVMAARDPWRHRLVVQVLIVFTALATVAILTRVLFHHEPYPIDPAWFVLPFAAAIPVLLAVFYPRAPND